MNVGSSAFYDKMLQKSMSAHTHSKLAYEQERIKGKVESLEIMKFVGLEKCTGACNYV